MKITRNRLNFTPSILLISLSFVILLAGLLYRDGNTPISTYGKARYLMMVMSVIATLAVFFVPWRLFSWLYESANRLVLASVIGLVIALPLPYIFSMSFGANDIFPTALGIGIILWILAVGIAIPSNLRMEVFAKLIAVTFGTLMALLIVEIELRSTYFDDTYQLRDGNLSIEFRPLPDIFPGIEGTSFFTVDEYGIRGAIPYDDIPEGDYRILAIGGSTTEDLYLDDSEAWTQVLMDDAQADDAPVWVGNIGRAGDKAIHHYYAMTEYVPRLEIDMVLMMIGINELSPMMRTPEIEPHKNRLSIAYLETHPDDAGRFVFNGFAHAPLDRITDKTGIAIIDFWKREIEPRIWTPESDFVQNDVGSQYIDWRNNWYASAQTLTTLPDIFPEALEYYRENLNLIADVAEERNIQLVYLTQPVVWSEDLPADFEHMLWMIQLGERVKPTERYPVPLMAEAMQGYNDVMLQVCEARDLLCIDLAADMNGNTDYFYDDVHFNEAGARRVAELVWQGLRDHIEVGTTEN